MIDDNIATLYSVEMRRLLWWRQVIETSRNLSVFIVAGMAFVAFGFPSSSHLVLYLGSTSVFLLLIFESRTYRYAEASERRVRELEKNILAPALDAVVQAESGWAAHLAQGLVGNSVQVSFLEALAMRVYKAYFIIFVALDICWFSKLYLYPQPAAGWSEFIHRADMGFFPGWLVLLVIVPVWTSYVILIIWVRKKQKGREPHY